MQNTIYHWIPVSVLAEITKQSPRKLQKLYRKIIQDDCVPLNDIPRSIQDIYVSEYLLRDRVIDFSFLDAVRDYSTKPLFSPDVQSLFREMQMMRRALLTCFFCAFMGENWKCGMRRKLGDW